MNEKHWSSCVVFAERLASRFFRMIPAGHVEYEELKSAALLGLAEAGDRYRSDCGASFKTFAYLRIRGAMCDYIRREYRFSSKHTIQPEEPTGEELPDPEFTILGRRPAEPAVMESLEQRVALRLAAGKIQSAMQAIGGKQQAIVQKYYFEDKSFSEIGHELGGIAKATVWRYHKKAIRTLREEFSEVA